MIKSSKGELKYYLPENELVRTQDLEKSYYDCGQFYWASLNTWKTISKIHSNALGTEVPNWLAVDIDTVDDWNRAEIIKRLFNFYNGSFCMNILITGASGLLGSSLVDMIDSDYNVYTTARKKISKTTYTKNSSHSI